MSALRLSCLLAPCLAMTLACAEPSAKPLRAGDWQKWTQEERERAFAQWDTFHTVRIVAHGPRVHALATGAVFAAFSPGTDGGAKIDRMIVDQKVAGIVVLQDGAIRFERYALGHSAAGRWTSHSVAKSVTSTLVGAAIKDGYIKSVDDLVTTYIPAMRGSAYDGVTIRHLLTMTSGVKWNEDYRDPASDVARVHNSAFDPALGRTVSYMRTLARAVPPGTKWSYNTGETHLLGEVVAHATNKPLATYLAEKIWTPYGMEQDASWTIDASGHEVAGCCFQAALRDYARFGQFILDGARVDDRSVVADGWLEEATRKQRDTGRPGRGYGYQWWTRDDGTFDGIGIYGQRLHIDRARRLVVAINSAWPVPTGQAQSTAQLALLDAIAAAAD
jgi:CubicO group peptidase (beta-lactamase class C family)